jgi:membrane associated rhomboid family serine protease
MNRFTPAVLVLVIANAAVFLAGMLVPAWRDRIVEVGAFWFPSNENFRPWQAVTYMFLHGGGSHLIFNMIAAISFGVPMERRWGTGRFLVFWFLCGIGAGLIHTGVSEYQYHALADRLMSAGVTPGEINSLMTTGSGEIPTDPAVKTTLISLYRIYAAPMLGASGAIYGVLVAFGFMYPNAKMALLFFPFPIAAKFFIPGLLAVDLLSGVTGFSLFGGGVAHFAHLGGAAIGFLLMMLWRRKTPGPELYGDGYVGPGRM